MEIELIIFDFDGTLGDTQRTIVTTMQMTITELKLPKRSNESCSATIGLPLTSCFKTLFPDLSADNIQRCADTYRRIFYENVHTIKPKVFPGVVDTLAELKRIGFTLTIASSRSHKSLVELTHDLLISDYITYIIGADDVKKAKPNPEPVMNTLSATGFVASQALVVGDMSVDILMGANAGAKTCGVTYGNGTQKELEDAGADYIIHSIDELIWILEK
ncbi:MAG: HAD family hydrolase [Bacteroidaceae bacterium]|nr:HAD family hydrolase [Bacteroidaceae bacterium]